MVEIDELWPGMKVVMSNDFYGMQDVVKEMLKWQGKTMTLRSVHNNPYITMEEDAGECPSNSNDHKGWWWHISCIDHIILPEDNFVIDEGALAGFIFN